MIQTIQVNRSDVENELAVLELLFQLPPQIIINHIDTVNPRSALQETIALVIVVESVAMLLLERR